MSGASTDSPRQVRSLSEEVGYLRLWLESAVAKIEGLTADVDVLRALVHELQEVLSRHVHDEVKHGRELTKGSVEYVNQQVDDHESLFHRGELERCCTGRRSSQARGGA